MLPIIVYKQAMIVFAIIFLGIATSTSTMSYLLAMCTVRPEMQDKIRYDIDRNIGSRVPRLEDKSNIPYLEAAILETLRIMSNVPLFLPHKTTTDVEFEGYNIPRNTQVNVVIQDRLIKITVGQDLSMGRERERGGSAILAYHFLKIGLHQLLTYVNAFQCIDLLIDE